MRHTHADMRARNECLKAHAFFLCGFTLFATDPSGATGESDVRRLEWRSDVQHVSLRFMATELA